MRGVARIAAATLLAAGATMPAAAAVHTTTAARAVPSGIPLPPTLRNIDPLSNPFLGLRKDRLRKSSVPGLVDDTEAVTVAVGPDGVPSAVTDRQRLVIHGAGPYLVYELGPARAVQGLNDFSLPTTDLGQVVWQGFSPRSRTLEGLLTLDPTIEAARLPLSVSLAFRDRSGHRHALLRGARAPDAGTIDVTLTNQTQSPRFVSVGTADAGPLAQILDTLLAAAGSKRAGVPPYAGNGLPKQVAGTLAGQQQAPVTAPLRITGTVGVVGSSDPGIVTGLGTTAMPGGATVSGTLAGSVTFTVTVTSGQQLSLGLDVQPWLDPRTLTPPAGATWAAWAAGNPSSQDRTQATATMIAGAAAAARAADYSPYLQTDTNGNDVSTFHYTVAAASTATRRAGMALAAKPGAIVAAVLALLAIAGNAALLRRRW